MPSAQAIETDSQPRYTLRQSKKGALNTNTPQGAADRPKLNTQASKSVARRSSKPIINWLQRKLAGGGKAKRGPDLPHPLVASLGRDTSRPRSVARVVSSPNPSSVYNGPPGKLENDGTIRRKTLSLDVEEESQRVQQDDGSGDRLSVRESIPSPVSFQEADDDASLRPIPPSAPPSPSPSRSSSSYLSDPRTFRSMTASTKPTTILSLDVNGNGMAHIAQAPGSPASQFYHRFSPHIRQSSSLSNPNILSSAGSITFSALPQSSSSRPGSLRNPGSPNNVGGVNPQSYGGLLPVQAPLHTAHHPRNNPRPSSPPLDNASILTLASSAYASPARFGGGGASYSMNAYNIGGDSISHFGGSAYAEHESTSQFLLGDEERDDRDVDASVRALRPRSSRRNSWESEASRWSARVQAGIGSPSLARERSVWTTNSVRTGRVSPEIGEEDNDPNEKHPQDRDTFTQVFSPTTEAQGGEDADSSGSSSAKSLVPLPQDAAAIVSMRISEETER